MAETPRSSFIPKQTSSSVPSSVRRKRHFHVFNFLSAALLVVSLMLGGGTYFYSTYASADLDKEKVNLASERDRFSEGDISAVREFNKRLMAAELLLNSHIAPSKIFDALELATMEHIQFTSFSFEQRPSQDVTLTILGGTEEFKTVALQALQFEGDPLFENALFTEIGTDGANVEEIESGNQTIPADDAHRINFSITGDIAAALLAFEGGSSAQPVSENDSPDASGSEIEDLSGTDESSEEANNEEVTP